MMAASDFKVPYTSWWTERTQHDHKQNSRPIKMMDLGGLTYIIPLYHQEFMEGFGSEVRDFVRRDLKLFSEPGFPVEEAVGDVRALLDTYRNLILTYSETDTKHTKETMSNIAFKCLGLTHEGRPYLYPRCNALQQVEKVVSETRIAENTRKRYQSV